MRPSSAGEVREALSSEAASRFFEAWAEVTARTAGLEEQRGHVAAQRRAARANAQAADTLALEADRQANEREARAGAVDGMFALEARALAELSRRSAAAARAEASARQDRAELLERELATLDDRLREARADAARLRERPATFGAQCGEALLWFEDRDPPGACWFVPLVPFPFAGGELAPFVLHRLAAGATLSEAAPVRDGPLLATLRPAEGLEAAALLEPDDAGGTLPEGT